MNHIEYKNNELMIENVSAANIANVVGTPCYVYSRAAFIDNLRAYNIAFSDFPHLVCYSVKVASNLSLLKLVAGEAGGADIVSGGELFRSLKAGIEPSKIVYSGVGKTSEELSEALEAGILMFNLESEGEMELLNEIAASKNLFAPVSFRVNPNVDPKTHPYISTGLKNNKFGIPHQQALEMYAKAAAKSNLNVVGLDCHIGSQILELSPFQEAANKVYDLLNNLKAEGHSIKYLDFGGGLGIPYENELKPSLKDYAKILKDTFKFSDITLILEPGRSIAGDTALLLNKVLYLKESLDKSFVIVDGAMNDLIRPSLYGAKHQIMPVKQANQSKTIMADVVGPICESGDFFAKDVEVPEFKTGDLLAVATVGAYGFSMSSNYNSRRKSPEVLVDGDKFSVIRSRETYEDLIKTEI